MRGCEHGKEGGGGLVGRKDAQRHRGDGQLQHQHWDCCPVTSNVLSLGPDDRNSMKTDLMKVPMILMDWEKCSKLFPKLTKNMLCAGYENESYDACQVTKGNQGISPIGPYPPRAADTRVSSLHWE